MKKLIEKIRRFLDREIWRIDLKRVHGPRHFGIKLIRTLIIAWRGFKQDNCQLKASAMTFYTLLSIVPVIALLFGLAKGFGLEKKLEMEMKTDLSYNQEILTYVFDLANSMLENTKGGLIAGLGVLLLFWTVMKVLGNIEQSFNDIWEVKIPRSLVRKFSDYLSIMLVTPILTILSGSIAVFLTTQIKGATGSIGVLENMGPVIFFLLQLLPVMLTMVLFAVVYIVLPNTKVNVSAAFFGGLIAAIFFHAVEWVYLTFQVGVSRYNAIYGGFAALPLFLGWVQTNWLIVMLGGELSFAYQNQGKYEFEIESEEISNSFKYMLALIVTHELVKKFKQGEEAPTASELSAGLQMPAKLVRKILWELVDARVISEIAGGEKRGESKYQPAIDLSRLDIQFVTDRLSDKGINDLPIKKNADFEKIEKTVNAMQEQMRSSKFNSLISEL